MSRNSKNRTRILQARAMKMKKGPARTVKKNTKVNVWWRKPKAAPNAKSSNKTSE